MGEQARVSVGGWGVRCSICLFIPQRCFPGEIVRNFKHLYLCFTMPESKMTIMVTGKCNFGASSQTQTQSEY